MASDLYSSLRKAADSISNGEKIASEVGSAFNTWAKESGEALKERIDSEFESAALRLGFVRKSDLALLQLRIENLEMLLSTTNKAKTKRRTKASPSMTTVLNVKKRAVK